MLQKKSNFKPVNFNFLLFLYVLRSNSPTKRHARVKNWTRNVNIFEKDFLIVPINRRAHWYMAIICFPHLTEPVYCKAEESIENNNENQDETIKKEKKEVVENIETRSNSRKKTTTPSSSIDIEPRKPKEQPDRIERPRRNVLTAHEVISENALAITSSLEDDTYEQRVLNKFKNVKNCVKM